MYFDEFNTDDVFNHYAKIMTDEGHLEKKAKYVAPRGLLGEGNYSEIDTNSDLMRIAAENGGDKLYGLFTEDVMSNAHPEGSTKIVDAPDGLGEVETLEDSQKKMKEVAEMKVKLAQKVLELSSALDSEGFSALAKGLDSKVASFLGQSIEKTAILGPEKEELATKLSDAVAQALDLMQTEDAKNFLKNESGEIFLSAVMDPGAAEKLPKYYVYLLNTLSELGEMAARVALDKPDLKNDFDSFENMPGDTIEEPGMAKDLSPDAEEFLE